MFTGDLTRRIQKVEDEIAHCNEVKSVSLATEAALTQQLKELGGILKGHAAREEVLLKEQVSSGTETTTILLEIKSDIHGIKNDLELQAKDNAISLLKNQETMKTYCNKEFATAIDMEKGFRSLRNQAKIIWFVLLAVGTIFAWATTTLISIYPLTNP